jgi:hypothetical protein
MKPEYVNGRPTERFREYINAFIERTWPGAARARSRAMDAADPNDAHEDFGPREASDADVRELGRFVASALRDRRKDRRNDPAGWGADLKRRGDCALRDAADYNGRFASRAQDGEESMTDLEFYESAAAEHLRLC